MQYVDVDVEDVDAGCTLAEQKNTLSSQFRAQTMPSGEERWACPSSSAWPLPSCIQGMK